MAVAPGCSHVGRKVTWQIANPVSNNSPKPILKPRAGSASCADVIEKLKEVRCFPSNVEPVLVWPGVADGKGVFQVCSLVQAFRLG